jgi:hypothetical protein
MGGVSQFYLQGVPIMARSKREYYVVMILLSLFSTLGFAERDVFTPVVASLLTAGVQPFPGTGRKPTRRL